MGANVKMTKLSVVLIIVISTLLGYVFGVLPLWREWQGLEGRMERLHMEYQRDSRTVAHLSDSLQQYREHEGVTKQTRTNEEEVAFFLKEIESFVENLNMSINDIKPLADEDREGAHIFLIEVELAGTIQDLMVLLHEIARSQTLIVVEKMNLAAESRRTNILTVKLVFSKTFLV